MTQMFRPAAMALAALAALLAAGVARAQQPDAPNATDGGGMGAGGAVAQMALAQDLYQYGTARSDALAVLAAARIAMSVQARDVEREKETKDIEGFEGTEEGSGVDAPVTARDMLAEAGRLAGENSALAGLVAGTGDAGSRPDPVGTANRTYSNLHAGKTDVFKVPFYGGRLAELAIVGDGDSNLDLVVSDEDGNVICLDRSYSDKLYCSFTPRVDGAFFIGVRNQGRLENSYYILTN